MLESHINAIERVLIAQSVAAQNAGHPNLRGGPREWFIRDFLEGHLPSNLEIGQGEIIDQNSKPEPPQEEYRPQVDIVLYRRDLPKIAYSRDNAAFLAEGVMATIESKSLLTKKELSKACEASMVHKSLKRDVPPASQSIISYVIAYDGPKNMKTVANWLVGISSEEEFKTRPDHMVDVVLVLGRGIVLRRDVFNALLGREEVSNGSRWVFSDQSEKNLYMMFVHMLTSWTSIASSPPNTLGYVSKVYFESYDTV